ncbi:putative subtilisin-like protease precursor [Neoconidiobolus thromboides FSU 785]|nr:putative subtilisin-like protease precursor [Neoconidiobolus thromboides FSU 785]
MKFINSLFSLTLLSTILSSESPVKISTSAIDGDYLVGLRGDARSSIDAHINTVKGLMKERSGNNKIETVFNNLGNLYHAKFNNDLLQKVRALPDVEFIENNKQITVKTVQENADWGIARISQRNFTKKTTYTYDGEGEGVAVYVIDTGVFVNHPEFEGRARSGPFYAGNNTEDEYGHGTHCAGIIASKTYGVAKKAQIISIKMIDGSGKGDIASLIKGMDWAVGDKAGVKGNVVSLSLGGDKDTALNAAVEATYQKGFVVVAAAGNENEDACTRSPGSAPNAITVGASDKKDEYAYFSNYGKCVDIIAPGVDILAPWKDGSVQKKSGTSMACPNVAGLAAYYLSKENLTNAQVTQKIISSASKGFVKYAGKTTPNLLAYNSIA